MIDPCPRQQTCLLQEKTWIFRDDRRKSCFWRLAEIKNGAFSTFQYFSSDNVKFPSVTISDCLWINVLHSVNPCTYCNLHHSLHTKQGHIAYPSWLIRELALTDVAAAKPTATFLFAVSPTNYHDNKCYYMYRYRLQPYHSRNSIWSSRLDLVQHWGCVYILGKALTYRECQRAHERAQVVMFIFELCWAYACTRRPNTKHQWLDFEEIH